MFNRTSKILIAVLFFSLLAVACGTQLPAQQPVASNINGNSPAQANQPAISGQATLPSVNTGEGGNGEAGGGVESALVTYSDAAQKFAIGHPGGWTQDTTVTKGVKFVGGDDSMTLAFVTHPAGTNAMTYAQSDVATVSAAFPGFKQLNLNPSTEVMNAVILGFNANGTSAVTGKTFTAHNERYYMPLADGRIAILTVVSPENHYDQQGVRDIALTLVVTK